MHNITDRNNNGSLMQWLSDPDRPNSPLVRPIHRLARLVMITITEFQKNDLSLRSAALTYTVLLSLVPIMAMSTAVVKGLGGGDQLRRAAYTYLETLETQSGEPTHPSAGQQQDGLPTGTQESAVSLTGHLRSAADQLFDYVEQTNFATLGTIGILGILLSVVLVFGTIETAMNTIWKVPSGRSIIRKLADYLTLLILLPLSINVAFAAGAFLQSPALASKLDIFIPVAWLQNLLLGALPVLIIAFSFFMMYIFFPNTKVRTLPAVLGAGVAAILWFSMQNMYISLQVGVAKYNAIYGSFATLPLFLVWVYFGWMFILIGAQLAFAFQQLPRYQFAAGKDSPAVSLALAIDMVELLQTSLKDDSPVTPEDLPQLLPAYSRDAIRRVTSQLLEASLIHQSQQDERLLPATTSRNIARMVRLIFGEATPSTPGGRQSDNLVTAAIAGCEEVEKATADEQSSDDKAEAPDDRERTAP